VTCWATASKVRQITTLFDADNHYWEASDAFTRHRDAKFAERGVQVKEVDGVLRHAIDGEVFATLPGPGDVHPRPKPGAFLEYFKGKTTRQAFLEAFNVAPSEHPEWYDRDARLARHERTGRRATWLFPSQGVVLEAPMLASDVERRSRSSARSTAGSTNSGASRTSSASSPSPT